MRIFAFLLALSAAAIAAHGAEAPDEALRRADMLAQRGLCASALKLYRERLATVPGDMAAKLGAAECLLRGGELDVAESELLQVRPPAANDAQIARAQAALARIASTRQAQSSGSVANQAAIERQLQELREAEIRQAREAAAAQAAAREAQNKLASAADIEEKYRLSTAIRYLNWLRIYDSPTYSYDTPTPILTQAIRFYQVRSNLPVDGTLTKELVERLAVDVDVVMHWATACFGQDKNPAMMTIDSDGKQRKGYESSIIAGKVAISQALLWHSGASRGAGECIGCNFKVCLAPPPEIVIRPDYGAQFSEPK